MGRLPRRVGFDGGVPVSWADGKRRWDGWLTPEEYPRIVDPPGGQLWTANARVVDGAWLARLGDGGYDLGAVSASAGEAARGPASAAQDRTAASPTIRGRAGFLRAPAPLRRMRDLRTLATPVRPVAEECWRRMSVRADIE